MTKSKAPRTGCKPLAGGRAQRYPRFGMQYEVAPRRGGSIADRAQKVRFLCERLRPLRGRTQRAPPLRGYRSAQPPANGWDPSRGHLAQSRNGTRMQTAALLQGPRLVPATP